MPMHDWTRVDPNDYHDMHVGWIAALRHHLNTGGLPPGYFALAEHTAPPVVPDVLTMQLADARRPGAAAHAAGGDGDGDGGVAVAEAPPRVAFSQAAEVRGPVVGRGRRVAVKHVRGRRLVAVIEVMSPSNKGDRPAFADFVDKLARLAASGVHLLVVDPFPPTARDPGGIHPAAWRRITRRRPGGPADPPLTAVAYAVGRRLTAYVERFAVGQPVPDMPLFLSAERYVTVPLEATYQAAWAGFPAPLRPLVEAAAGPPVPWQ